VAISAYRSSREDHLDFGAWQSEVASGRSNDSSLSFVTISAGGDGLDVVVTNGDKERALVIRDEQREYRYQNAK
jgi:hypothetical protein